MVIFKNKMSLTTSSDLFFKHSYFIYSFKLNCTSNFYAVMFREHLNTQFSKIISATQICPTATEITTSLCKSQLEGRRYSVSYHALLNTIKKIPQTIEQ